MNGTCPVCAANQTHSIMCTRCWRTLHRDLTAVPDLLAELDTTAARQARTQPAGPNTTPARERDHINTHAAQTSRDLHHTLTHWARALGHPAYYATTAAHRLTANAEHIRRHPDAVLIHTAITHATDQARRAIDTPAVRTAIPVGPCPDCDHAEVTAWFPATDPPYMACNGGAQHRWDTTQWLRTGGRILRVIDAKERA